MLPYEVFSCLSCTCYQMLHNSVHLVEMSNGLMVEQEAFILFRVLHQLLEILVFFVK